MYDKILDLYTDYLMILSSQASTTGLSRILDNQINHDKITMFLISKDFTSKNLCNKVKKVVRESTGIILCKYYVQILLIKYFGKLKILNDLNYSYYKNRSHNFSQLNTSPKHDTNE